MVLENIYMRTRKYFSCQLVHLVANHATQQLYPYAYQLLIYMLWCQMKITLLFIIQQTKDSYGATLCVCFWMKTEPKAIFCNKVANICMLCRRPACWILHMHTRVRIYIKVRYYHGTTMTCIQSMLGHLKIWLLKDS